MNLSSSPPPGPMASALLVPLPDGPYEVTGPLTIARPNGEPIESPAPKVYLCRCGGSANKPFCDGLARPERLEGGVVSDTRRGVS